MRNRIHQTSFSAWADLCNRGGLELNGRDEGLDIELKNRLIPSAASLEEALQSASTDDLVRALFDVMQPFVQMFRAILQFFENAGASEGCEQWNIKVDDVDFRLKHFLQFLKKWDTVDCEIEAPGIDFSGAWAVINACRNVPGVDNLRVIDDRKPYLSGISDVDDWLRAYRAGQYKEMPPSLSPTNLAAGYSDAAAMVLAALHVIRKSYASRDALIEERRQWGFAIDRADGLSPRTIAQNETDFWLGATVGRLARCQTLAEDVKNEVASRLVTEFSKYPRKQVGARLPLAELEKFLSLPVWKKRHELYAVWIATEIINALEEHDCKIHHDEGKITFSFRETRVATIETARPVVKLISERRVPFDSPVGKGRVANVQPDYGLWRSEAGEETCGLVVEVKHYKRQARTSFANVLTDYARAFPKAEVYLVNYGPVESLLDDLPREIWTRCKTVSELTPSNFEAREQLQKAVRAYVGAPVRPTKARGTSALKTVLAVDISGSMSDLLRKSEFTDTIESLAEECTEAALVDVRVRVLVPFEKLLETVASTIGGSTDLQQPIESLLRTYERVIVITDDEGLGTLKGLSANIVSKHASFIVVELERPIDYA